MLIKDKHLVFGAPDYTEAEIEAVSRVMRAGWVGMGTETLTFEKELTAYTGASHVVTVNSCTSALFLSLLAEGIKPGDEVILPSLTWCSDANVVLQSGGVPVLCDIDKETLSVTPESIIRHVTSKTKAVIVVHFGGYAVDVKELREALPSRVSIIEDAAHAFGACYPDGKKVGSSGNSVCFSFYANKNLSTADGGAIALHDPKKAERLRTLRMNGLPSTAWARYLNPKTLFSGEIIELGYKMNYTDLQAAIGRVQLARFEKMEAKRKRIASLYQERMKSLGLQIKFQKGVFAAAHARHLLVGFFDERITKVHRDDLLLALREKNIGVSIHYAPLHQMAFYQSFSRGNLEVTENISKRIMTLPISAKMTLEEVDFVTEHLGNLILANRENPT